MTTCRAGQSWFIADDVVTGVTAGGRDFSPDDPEIRLLGGRREVDGSGVYPGTFRFSPRTGRPLAPAAPEVLAFGRPFSAERGTPVVDLPHRSLAFGPVRVIDLHPGRASLFSAGHPSALYAFHDNLGTLEWLDEATGTWRAVGSLPVDEAGGPDSLPDFAQALVARRDGVAFATRQAIVFLPLPQVGPVLDIVPIALHGTLVHGAPLLDGDRLFAPAYRDGRLGLLTAAIGRTGPADAPAFLPVEDGRPEAEPGFFAPPVANRAGVGFWPDRAGTLRFDPRSGRATFRPWSGGFDPILVQRPHRDRQDIFHQLGWADGAYGLDELAGPRARRLDGPHLALGTRLYWAEEAIESLDSPEREDLPLPPADRSSVVVPLIGLGRDALVALVRPDGTVGRLVAGEPLPAIGRARLFHHQHLNGLHDLRTSLELRSLSDLAAFVHGGAVHVHSRAENRCVVLPLLS